MNAHLGEAEPRTIRSAAVIGGGTMGAGIDAAMRAYGFAMGPFEAQDPGGIDIAFLQREGARAAGQGVPETTLGARIVSARLCAKELCGMMRTVVHSVDITGQSFIRGM